MFKKLSIYLIAISSLLLLISPVFVFAQTTSNAIEVPKYGGVQDSIAQFLCTPSEGAADGKDLERCINKMYRFGISFGGIALVFFLVFAGYMYIMGGESGKTKAKGIVQNALVGIAILLGSYVILYFINPSLTIIKPIQPPIFNAADLPRCEDIGFEDTCVIDGTVVANGGTGRGEKVPCPGNTIVTIGSLGLPGDKDRKICKGFGELLLKVKSLTPNINWVITSTIRDRGTISDCHRSNNNFSGTCADIDISGADALKIEPWNALCKAMRASGVYPHNEVGHANSGTDKTLRNKLSECGSFSAESNATGDHIHSMWRTSVGGGGSTSTSGGSRPHCRPIHKFLCDHPANDSGRADPYIWTSAIPEIQANLNELKKVCGTDDKKCLGYSINQVYRSPEYGAHMRSMFEAYAILYEGWSDSKVSKHGQYCDGSIQYVKEADLKGITKDSEIGKYIKAHFNGSAKHFSGIGSPTTCLSNHGQGIALDFATQPVESKVVGPGKLCHNLPGDPAHFILYSKKRANENCTF